VKNLSYETLDELGYTGYLLMDASEKVLQFGDGNFLRAFADYFFDLANERTGWNGKVCMVQPRSNSFARADAFNAQEGLFTVCTRGRKDGVDVDERRIVSCVSRCLNPRRGADYRKMMEVAVSDDLEIVVSNTTEAGIVYDDSCKADDEPPESFPAKLAQILHARWQAGKPGVVILSCELIDNNGAELRRCVGRHVSQWGWEEAFSSWLDSDCTFCTTLVDSIVPGRIRDAGQAAAMDEACGYHDAFVDVREVFDMWGIQGDASLEDRLPFGRAGLGSVFVTPDVAPYKKRKVRILNGAHTGFVPGAYLAGFDIVRDCMHDDVIRAFMEGLLNDEVIPTLVPALDEADCRAFASSVVDRFDNPFVDHRLLDICLNSTAKWRARDLPVLLDDLSLGRGVPSHLAMSLAALLAFYTSGSEGVEGDGLHLVRPKGDAYVAHDDAWVLSFFADHASDGAEGLAHVALSNVRMWGQDLTLVEGLEPLVASDLALIREQGAREAFATLIG
jgi:tagaturonate reductase